MWQNSTELFDYALRELSNALNHNNSIVTIELMSHFTPSKNNTLEDVDKKLKIGEITKMLRANFCNHTIKSVVETGPLRSCICFEKGPCVMSYPLIWTLTIN